MATKKPGAGSKGELLAFDKRGVGTSTYGKKPGDWEEQFKTSARVQYLRGGEPIIGQRQTGINPVIITVHSFSGSRLVTTGWRARDVRSGVTYNIRTVTPGERLFELDILADTGGPDG